MTEHTSHFKNPLLFMGGLIIVVALALGILAGMGVLLSIPGDIGPSLVITDNEDPRAATADERAFDKEHYYQRHLDKP
jgi:hypothetical protein